MDGRLHLEAARISAGNERSLGKEKFFSRFFFFLTFYTSFAILVFPEVQCWLFHTLTTVLAPTYDILPQSYSN